MKHKKRSPAFPLLPDKDEYCRVNGKLKRKYKTEMDAELNAPTRDLQQYVCEFCGFWHNGNQSLAKATTTSKRS